MIYAGTLGGILALDITVPTDPAAIGSVPFNPVVRGLAATETSVLIASSTGLTFLSPQCDDGPVPTFLQELRANHELAGIRVDWCVSGELPVAFRLEARRMGATGSPGILWYPEVQQVGPSCFEAIDAVGAAYAGRLRYGLLADFAGDGSWMTLGETSTMVTLPAFEARVEAIAPNPFNPRANITFTLSRASHAVLTIHDLQGHRVAILVDEPLASGRHTVVWNGGTNGGDQAAAGTYVARLTTPERVATKKLMLVR